MNLTLILILVESFKLHTNKVMKFWMANCVLLTHEKACVTVIWTGYLQTVLNIHDEFILVHFAGNLYCHKLGFFITTLS